VTLDSKRSKNLLLRTTLLLLFSLSPAIFTQTHATSIGPPTVNPVLTGLNFPVSLGFAPDGRIFYNEKDTGNIRVIQPNGTLLPAPFATVNPVFNTGEAGLLGIALDPSFSSNNYVYVYYTYRDTGSFTHGHIVRYTASGNTGTSPRDIFDVTSSAPNTVYHNGGYIKFGPDGKLYAMVGEFHQGQQAQNQTSMTGKMLRMNADGSVPSDNPFPGSLDYAFGIRNSFGFDFDSSNNRIIATMAGPSSDDKILIIVKGGNYGWPTCLGICDDPRFINPTVDFNPVVTPTGIATVASNSYIFGEYNTGNLLQLRLNSTGGVVSMTQLYTAPGGIIAVETGPNNKLYFTTPDTIYTYNLPAKPAANAADTTLVILFIVAIIAVVLLMAYTGLRYRRRATRMRERADKQTSS
jgi:glucose/arabinose dehydrogenase